jgi:C1A family cysteine protease
VIVLFFMVFLVILINSVSALSNPSAVYCESLGYTYISSSISDGEIGICEISENVKLDAWDFFEGKTGQQYSYCEKNGYSVKTMGDGKNAYSKEYSACSVVDKSVTDLMNFSEKLSSDKLPSEKIKKFSSGSNIIKRIIANMMRALLTGNVVNFFIVEIPPNFDWRNYNGNWLTPVKNQGACGSCWAFATMGDMESEIKIARNDSNFDVDLSEQDLVSCGVPYGFYPGAGGCEGATLEDPLDYMNNTGITDEGCFPYTASDSPCSNKCSSSDKRLWKINNYGYVPLTPQDMKNYIVTKGPIIAGIYMAGSFVNGIYTCKKPGDNLNHAIVLVGYNDSGGYWIAKNSWGSNWNGNGYFKVGYGKCNIETYPMFIDLQINSTQKININNISVDSGIAEGNYSDLYYKDNLFMNYKCNGSNCSYDIRNVFSARNSSHITSLDIISYQNSSNGNASLNYLNNNSWESLGFISQIPYLVKYNLCSSLLECSNVFSAGNVFLRYSHSSSQNSLIDLLYLEAKAMDCEDNWTLNNTWTNCEANDTQYKNYYDLNYCYKNSSYLNMTVSQPCDYCIPSITQINSSCGANDNFVSWYNDSNKCYQQTGLESDKILDNQTLSCDYCIPNWTANETCNSDNSSTIWYSDSNSCFSMTNLSSDLQGKQENQTILNGCINNSAIENVSFCGDGTCDNNEDCSSCALDCGVCPVPISAPSGGGGGGGGGGGNIVSSSNQQIISNPANDNSNSNNPAPEQNQFIDETISEKTNSPQPFSLTGLIVSMQNNQSLRIILMFVIAIGGIAAFFLFRRYKFSKKHIHRNMVRIRRKRK